MIVVLSTLMSSVSCGGSDDSSPDAGADTSRPVTTTTAPGLVYRTEAATAAPAGSTTVGMTRYRFDPSNLEVKAGTVVFFLKNTDVPADDDPLDAGERKHTLAVVGPTGLTIAVSDRVEPQRAAVFTVESLAPGSYGIRCAIGGHARIGMVGTLDVIA